MSVVAALIWIAIGIFYVAHKGLFEAIGSQFLSILCIVLCVAGICIVSATAHYSDSRTIAIMVAVGLCELLVLAVTQSSSENRVACQIIVSAVILPLVVINGVIEILGDEKPWLWLVVIPLALYSAVKIRDIVRADQGRERPQWLKAQSPQDKAHAIRDAERLRAIQQELTREFPTQEQVRDIINRYQLPRYLSQYSFEIYSRWREEEAQRRTRSVEHKEADHDNKGF